MTRAPLLAAAVAAASVSPSASAQAYPAKPLRLIVAYAAGGGTDIVGRVFAQKLGDGLGRQVIVDNRPGAAGNIATELAIKSPADGYTLLMGNIGPMAVNPHLYKLAFDPLRDLAPVTFLAAAPLLGVVHPALPVGSLQDLIALARRRPDALAYSSAGVGSSNHLAGALFAIETATRITHVPYKGAAPAVTDLMAGNVQLSFQTLPSVGAAMRSKRVKALAVTSANRTGSPAATTCDEAVAALGDAVSIYLDAGPSPSSVASTIIDVTGDVPRVLRAGPLGEDRLRAVVPDLVIPVA